MTRTHSGQLTRLETQSMAYSAMAAVVQRAVLALALLPALGLAAERPRLQEALGAFSEVIREPAKSTVQVYCDGYRAALGAIVRTDGHVATKASELKGKIEIQLYDTRKFPATVVATDKGTDLAILKID